jgi:DNA-binding response OmpR family regulator
MNKAKVLIVEDEKFLATALKTKFDLKGYQVSLAANGDEALDNLAKDTFDIVLLDLMMPQKDGWSVLKSSVGKNYKIIVTSNLSQNEDIDEAKKLGALDFIIKSEATLSDVIERVEKILNKTVSN